MYDFGWQILLIAIWFMANHAPKAWAKYAR